MTIVRNYNPDSDYPAVEALYKNFETFGGQFDEARDSESRLRALIQKKPESILIAEKEDGKIIGTVTLFEDGRAAWLYRFAVEEGEYEAIQELGNKALEIMKSWGHTQVLVYAPVGDVGFEERYQNLGFTKGDDYTAFWKDL